MAYAAVSSLSQTIDLILNYHQQSMSLYSNQIHSIHTHALSLQSFLEDSPHRAYSWEEKIREIAYKAEDIIELLLSDSLLKPTVESSNPKSESGKFERPYGFNELERVTEEIESIADRVKGRHRAAMGDSNSELIETISRLRGGSSALEIISIFGMGGIGKTTLAKKAYHSPLIEEHFEIRAWSTIARDSVRRVMILDLLRSVINSNARSTSSSNSEEELMESVRKILRGRRYLIVLDDMWSLAAFEAIKSMLPDDGNGSRIILTTRLYNVAMAAAHVQKMCLLDEDRAWDLLQRKVFGRDHCPSQLEPFGRMIARRCEGHPLSIEVVSGMLRVDQTEAAWEEISENMNIVSGHVSRTLFEVPSLCYTYLPRHLRPCFLYLGLFPEDHEIYVSKLVKLWVAEGFLDVSESESFEKTGEKHVRDLVRRNLVSVVKRKSDGRIKSIRMHDVMWDFCLRQAHMDNFVFRVGSFDRDMELQLCRRVSNFNYSNDLLEGAYGSAIRTMMLNLDGSRLGFRLSFGNVRLLRILDLSGAYNCDLPEEVSKLFHLRYLAFDCRSRIPVTISRLRNLQTLIICPRTMYYAVFGMLAVGILEMPQLRHLVMNDFELPDREEGLFSLTTAAAALDNLQTLSKVANFVCSKENLRMIPNLVKLALVYSESVAMDDVELHNLIHLQKLEILKIEIEWPFQIEIGRPSYVRICLPLALKKLSLINVRLPWEYMKNVASLPNLQVLKLRNHACNGEAWETRDGGFSRLTFLLIEGSYLEDWITESSHFPKLKCLVLRECPRLREIEYSVGDIRTLELIEVDNNPSLLSSLEQIQKARQSLGDDRLRIRVV